MPFLLLTYNCGPLLNFVKVAIRIVWLCVTAISKLAFEQCALCLFLNIVIHIGKLQNTEVVTSITTVYKVMMKLPKHHSTWLVLNTPLHKMSLWLQLLLLYMVAFLELHIHCMHYYSYGTKNARDDTHLEECLCNNFVKMCRCSCLLGVDDDDVSYENRK